MKINFNIALQPLVNTCHTCMATLSEGSDAFDYFVSVPFLWPMLPSLHRKSFDNEEKGKKIMKQSWDITMLKARPGGYSPYRRHTSVSGAEGHGCWPLYVWNWEKISTIWEKQIKRETGFSFALPCTRSVYILFYFIVVLLFIFLFIYLFFYLSIYFFFHSPFMNSGLGSEGNHIVTSHLHPNFPGVPPGLLGGCMQW